MKKSIKIGDTIYLVSSDDNYLAGMGNNFEPHMVQLFRALIGPNDVIADIGANIGISALLFSTLVKKTYAFEPSPSTYQILSENLARNKITNVEAINLGLGHKEETLTITFAKNNRSGGYVSDKIRPETGHVTEEIRIDTLDHFFSDKEPAPTFLKIDVEGFEQNVIRGGGFLVSTRPTVVMEMNHFCLDVLQRITIPDFLDYMRSTFPYLYAVDTDNQTIVDLHVPDQAYMVMHEHVVKHRFPNLVGGFDTAIKIKLDGLSSALNQTGLMGGRMKSMLGRATDKLINAFKTPVLFKPMGKIEPTLAVRQAQAGETLEISVRVSNESHEPWCGYGDHPVLLSYHWNNQDDSTLIYDGIRSQIDSAEVAIGETIEQKMTVLAPCEKGNFRLVLTLVQEGVCWFEDRGFKCAELDVKVV